MKKTALILAYIAVLNFLSFHFAKNGMIKLQQAVSLKIKLFFNSNCYKYTNTRIKFYCMHVKMNQLKRCMKESLE